MKTGEHILLLCRTSSLVRNWKLLPENVVAADYEHAVTRLERLLGSSLDEEEEARLVVAFQVDLDDYCTVIHNVFFSL